MDSTDVPSYCRLWTENDTELQAQQVSKTFAPGDKRWDLQAIKDTIVSNFMNCVRTSGESVQGENRCVPQPRNTGAERVVSQAVVHIDLVVCCATAHPCLVLA